MRMPSLIYKSLLFALLLLPAFTQAQSNWGEDAGIDDVTLVVEKQKNITLPKANRSFTKMERKEKPTEKQQQQYSLQLVNYSAADLEPQFKMLSMQPDPLSKIYGNYARLGAGNYLSSLAEVYVGSKRSEKHAYGLSFKHRGSLNGPVDKDFSGESTQRTEAFGKIFSKKFEIDAKAGHERRGMRYYGYTLPPAEVGDIKQSYSTVYAQGLFKSVASGKSKFSYQAGASGHYFFDRSEAKEMQAGLQFAGSLDLGKGSKVTFDAAPTYNSYSFTDTLKRNRSWVSAGGAYHLSKEKLQLKLGAQVAFHFDTASQVGQIVAYPDIALQYQALPDKLTLYMGIKGGLQPQTMRSLTAQNPFLATNQAPDFTYQIARASLGLKANLASKLGLSLEAGYAMNKNMPFLVNSAMDSSKFQLLYDSGTVGILDVKATLQAIVGPITAGVTIGFNNYNTEYVKEAFHLPTLENKFSLAYSREKLRIGAEAIYLSGMKARFGNGEVNALKSILDINLTGSYEIAERISVFVEGKNLLGKNYQRYYLYPVKGVNLLVGASYIF